MNMFLVEINRKKGVSKCSEMSVDGKKEIVIMKFKVTEQR